MGDDTTSRLERRLAPLQRLPVSLRMLAASHLIGRAVPFVGTGGVRIEALGRDGVEVCLPLRRRVSNHLGSAHAAAVGLLVETAGGLAFAIHLPEARTPVVKQMNIVYRRISKGRLWARAAVPLEMLGALHTEVQGEVTVPVEVVDEAGGDLVNCQMVYAWFTRDASHAR